MADKAEVRNTYSQDYRGFFVTDAVGGHNEDGFFLLDFYNERQGFPESMAAEAADGKLKANLANLPPMGIREFQTRVYMTVAAAVRLRDFLRKQIEAATAEDDVQTD